MPQHGGMLAHLLLAAATAPPIGACTDCHTQQTVEWRLSMHAESLFDPLYLAMRKWARDDAGQAVAGACMTCHAVGTYSGRTAGVDCQACHRSHTAGGPEALAVHKELPVRGRRSFTRPHQVLADPGFVDGTTCMVCHAELKNAKGVPLCTTGLEVGERPGESGCTSCHRPHEFEGTSPAILARAATLAVEQRDKEVQVTVSNVGAGHGLPTGSALRQIRLDLVFTDAAGRRVGDNSADAAATFARLLRDAEGNAPAPPWKAVGVARDTRLARGESRRFTYPVPPGATVAQATLTYHRAPPALATRLGVAELPLLRPVIMTRLSRALH